MMAALKRDWNHKGPSVTSGGTANVQTLTYSVAPAAYVQGQCFVFLAGVSNTGATTLNVNALGAKNIKIGSTALSGSEIISGQVVAVWYDGTQFQLLRTGQSNGQIVGTATNDDAAVGRVGEYLNNTLPSGSAAALTTGTGAQVAALALTAGDWDVWAELEFTGGATTTVNYITGAINTTSTSVPDQTSGFGSTYIGGGAVFGTINPITLSLPATVVKLTANTTYYLNAKAAFGVSTMAAYGGVFARRRR